MGKFDDGSGEADTLQQQLMKLKSEISTASTTIKTAEMKMKHDTQELKKAEAELKKYEKDAHYLNVYSHVWSGKPYTPLPSEFQSTERSLKR